MPDLPDTLWCIRVTGPDEVHAMPSRAVAEATAEGWRFFWSANGWNELGAVVEEWPWSAASHAEDLTKQRAANEALAARKAMQA